MVELALKIVPCLALAWLLGFAVAWLLRGVTFAELNGRVEQLETELGTREVDLGAARRDLVAAQQKLTAFDAEPVPPPPQSHAEPPPASADDLKLIHGVGPVLERMLHRLGIHEFRQVALWTDTDIDFFDAQLERFRGRIRRENWVRSATEAHYKEHGEWLGSGAPAITMRDTDCE